MKLLHCGPGWRTEGLNQQDTPSVLQLSYVLLSSSHYPHEGEVTGEEKITSCPLSVSFLQKLLCRPAADRCWQVNTTNSRQLQKPLERPLVAAWQTTATSH